MTGHFVGGDVVAYQRAQQYIQAAQEALKGLSKQGDDLLLRYLNLANTEACWKCLQAEKERAKC